jgi:hypothetical protein
MTSHNPEIILALGSRFAKGGGSLALEPMNENIRQNSTIHDNMVFLSKSRIFYPYGYKISISAISICYKLLYATSLLRWIEWYQC